MGRAEVGGELRRYFSLYKSLEAGLAEVVVERRAGGATVRFRASVAGKPKDIGGLAGLVPDTARYRFELTLVGEGRDLKIAKAAGSPWSGRSSAPFARVGGKMLATLESLCMRVSSTQDLSPLVSQSLAAQYERVRRRVHALVEPLSREQLWLRPFRTAIRSDTCCFI